MVASAIEVILPFLEISRTPDAIHNTFNTEQTTYFRNKPLKYTRDESILLLEWQKMYTL